MTEPDTVHESATPETESAAAPDASDAPPDAPGAPRRRRRWLRWAALAVSVLVLGAAGAGWSLYQKLNGNIRTDQDTADELARYEHERPVPIAGKAQNILLLGSDTRGDGNGAYGRDEGSERADTAILLHIAADRKSALGVSIPRDLMTRVPECTARDGGRTRARLAQFNWAFEFGGTACTIRTVEKMTDIRVDHHLVVDFRGFKKLVDAVGGVEVCLSEPVHDKQALLDLPAGRQTLHGGDALGYVRARHGIGDGSDTGRIDRQQQFLGSLVKKVRSTGVLLNPGKVYPVLDAATSALTADSGLDSLPELYELVRAVRDIPEDQVRFLTVPRQSYALDANRDELVQPEADELFTRLRNDRPVHLASEGPDTADAGSAKGDAGQRPRKEAEGEGKADADSAYRGTTAARDICAPNGAENEAN
ncbi:LCP family protein [Streptomyces boncukensis]|uniref:LCP family protein n=1 Tax=Streptomyces boncukensis TaxID=2711219 RepID=UPI003B97737A